MPLAATITTERIFKGFLAPEHTFFYGHSYCGNPLGCAAALASLRVFREEKVIENLAPKIAHFTTLLDELAQLRQVADVRQCGLIAGIELHPHGTELLGSRVCMVARKHDLLTRPILNTLVLMPPLCITTTELTQMTTALRLAIEEICS